VLSISEDQLAPIKTAVSHSSDGVRRALDPSKPEDAAAIRAFLQLTGKTEQTHPGLYGDVDRLAAGPPAPADHEGQALDIVDRGRDSQGRATARVWHQDTDGGYVSGSLALALDADTHEPVALGYANRVGGGVTPAATRSATARPAPDSMTTVGFYHSQSSPDTDPKFGMVAQTAPVPATSTAITARVTAPVTTRGNAAVQIGLGRTNPGNDLDYFYRQSQTTLPQLVVPFTGTVNVQQSMANVAPTGQFTSGLVVSTQLYSLNGTSRVDHLASQPLNTKITGNTNTNVVTWSFPYDPTGTPGNYQSLMYNPYLPANDHLTAFFFSFQIPVQNPVTPVFSFNVCSTDWPDHSSVSCVKILDLQFWWHCVAEGTQVTLADGSTLPVEQVDNTRRVRTGDGGSLGVEATTRGLHKSRVVELRTSRGHLLVLTDGHPVVTPDGLRRAADLAVGDQVLTEGGPVELVAVAPIDADAVFANLKLVDEHDRARGLAGTIGTFLANGIVVGDVTSMSDLHQRLVHSLEYMTARIPERYHTDYASTLADIARDNIRYGGRY